MFEAITVSQSYKSHLNIAFTDFQKHFLGLDFEPFNWLNKLRGYPGLYLPARASPALSWVPCPWTMVHTSEFILLLFLFLLSVWLEKGDAAFLPNRHITSGGT